MITPESVNNGLLIFYSIGTTMLLVLIVLVYPTLREKSKKSK